MRVFVNLTGFIKEAQPEKVEDGLMMHLIPMIATAGAAALATAAALSIGAPAGYKQHKRPDDEDLHDLELPPAGNVDTDCMKRAA